MSAKEHYKNKIEKVDEIESWIHIVVSKLPNKSNKILDVGCGEGTYSKFLKKGDNEVWGIEISNDSAMIASNKIYKVIVQDAESYWNVPFNYFDVVTMLRYLEHVYDYNFQLQQVRKVLIKNGILIIYSPNLSILDRFKLLFGMLPAYAYSIEHIRQFTKPYLYKILKDNNFTPIYCSGCMFILPRLKIELKFIEKIFPNFCPSLIIMAKKNE